jgi:hypothetical protein
MFGRMIRMGWSSEWYVSYGKEEIYPTCLQTSLAGATCLKTWMRIERDKLVPLAFCLPITSLQYGDFFQNSSLST